MGVNGPFDLDGRRGSSLCIFRHPACGLGRYSARVQAPPDTGSPLDGTKYRLLSPLGRGGMGHVWLAEHVELDAEVVVKILDPSLVDRKDLGDRMRLEAQALGRVRHPNVVSVIDGGRTEAGYPFLVMERLHGRTLHAERAAGRSFTLPESLAIARQVLSGLAAVHAAGIVHRDVKPSNLFLCDPDVHGAPGVPAVVKLIDFGIVKVVADPPGGAGIRPLDFPTVDGTVLGTPSALSPEQALGRAVDHRADIYAVGLLLYQLLTGEHPFKGLTGAKLIRAYASRAPVPPSKKGAPGIAELDALVLRALDRDPAERYQTAADLIRALDALEREPRSFELPTRTEERPRESTPRAEPSAAPEPTERIGSAELRELDAEAGVLPPTATDQLPLTRTAPSKPEPSRHGLRFATVSCATAFLVFTALAFLLWR